LQALKEKKIVTFQKNRFSKKYFETRSSSFFPKGSNYNFKDLKKSVTYKKTLT